MKFLTLIVLSLAFASCVSTKSNSAKNPVAAQPKKKKSFSVDKVFEVEGGDKKYPAEKVVFEWQKYFLPAPPLAQRKKLEESIKVKNQSGTPQELLKRAQNQFALGELAECESTFLELLRIEPENVSAMIELANVYLRQRKDEKAREVLATANDFLSKIEEPDTELVARYRFALARSHLASGDREIGHRILSDLIGENPNFIPAYVVLASSYLAGQRDAVAEFVSKRALDQSPRPRDEAALVTIQGVIQERKGQYAAARIQYNKALELTPDYVPALINRAALSMRDLETGSAEEDLKRALSLDPSYPEAHLHYARVLRRTGRYDEARKSLEAALNIDPTNVPARYNLALVYAQHLKKSDEAMRLMNEILQTAKAQDPIRMMATQYLEDLKINKL